MSPHPGVRVGPQESPLPVPPVFTALPSRVAAVVVLSLAVASGTAAQQPLGTAFTYQGRLTDAGAPATGSYDFEMRLFDAATDGAQVGPTVTAQDVAVAAGAFSVQLDFGSSPFGAERRWLQMAVRPGASTSAFTPLTPRQELTPTPTALVATRANTVENGTIGAAAIDPTAVQVRVTGQCAAGSSIRQVNADGSVVCQADTAGGGSVSAVTAGAGLSGGTITTTGTIAIATGGITSTMVASGAIGLAQIDQTQVQARVAASCADGQFLRGIAANGTPQCAALPIPPRTGVVMAADGRLGAIVRSPTETYLAQVGPDPWHPNVARCLNAPCQGVTALFTASFGAHSSVPQHMSLALTSSGLPMVTRSSFELAGPSVGAFGLYLDRCLNAACTSVETDELQSSLSERVGLFSALVNGADVLPVALYSRHDGNFPAAFLGLRLARCTNAACSSVSGPNGDVGSATRPEFALVVAGGVPFATFIENDRVGTVRCDTAACATLDEGILVGDDPGARHPSMAVGTDGRPVVAYSSASGLKFVQCLDVPCGKAEAPVVLDATATGAEVTSAIAVASDGRPTIAYLNGTTVNLVRCGNATCTSGNIRTTIDAARTDTSDLAQDVVVLPARVGLVLVNDLPVITYPDLATGQLKTASCSTATCS